MTSEFPKNRDGWSGPGRTAARTLVRDDEPESLTWLRKRRFNAEARNKGGHLVVTVKPQDVGLFLSLGVEAGETLIRGSRSTGTAFALTKTASASALYFDQLIPRGDGSAYTTSTVSYAGDAASIFGTENESYTIGSYIVRPGQDNETRPAITFKGATDGDTQSRLTNVYNTLGARRAGAYEHAMAYASIDTDGQHCIAVTFDDGAAQRAVIASKTVDQITFPVGFDRVGPGAFLGMGGSFLWRGAALGWYDQTLAPGLFFFGTLDDGATWFKFDDATFIASEKTAFEAAANNGATDRLIYNQAMNTTAAYIVPLTRTKALVYACLGSPDLIPVVGGRYENFRVRVGVADLEARTVTSLATLYDPPFTTTNLTTNRRNAVLRWERGACIAPNGGALVFFNDADYPANWTNNPAIFFTDGASWQSVGNLPFEAGRAGTPAALSRARLFMPVLDGPDHVLFASEDRGLTWVRGASISTLATETLPGAADSRTGPRSFNNVAALQVGGTSATATPGAPWLSDDRVNPPS